MSIKTIVAVIAVYALAVGAWAILGSAMALRSNASITGLDKEVRQLWGEPIVQNGPSFTVRNVSRSEDGEEKITSQSLIPIRSEIEVAIELEHRKKGLIWYPTFECDFDSSYTLENTSTEMQSVDFYMPFPSRGGTYDAFLLQQDNRKLEVPIDVLIGVKYAFELPAGTSTTISLHFKTRGVDSWSYHNTNDRIKNFSLIMDCNFKKYDFIGGAISDDNNTETADGVQLTWVTKDRITQQFIGIEMPVRVNPGPLSARMTFFAPVCLIFFFALLAAIACVRRIEIHPMHYFFVACGFFAFHLLFAYLVDLLDVHTSFAISASATLLLVTSYLRAALHGALPIVVAIGGQLFFLVLFSYSFFLNGTTGLVVAIGSVLTLAVMMRITADVDWKEFFANGRSGESGNRRWHK